MRYREQPLGDLRTYDDNTEVAAFTTVLFRARYLILAATFQVTLGRGILLQTMRRKRNEGCAVAASG